MKLAKKFKFKHYLDKNVEYTATACGDGNYLLTWENYAGEQRSDTYSVSDAEYNIYKGNWEITEVFPEEQQYIAYVWSDKDITMLDKIKDFCRITNCHVTINHNGEYEVSNFSVGDYTLTVESDEDLLKLFDALKVINSFERR